MVTSDQSAALLLSVNIGSATPTAYSDVPLTGIDKRPVEKAVDVCDPGRDRTHPSGLSGDAICDVRHHGGREQAVYAYAREDLDEWEAELGRPLGCGMFGENLTTRHLDVTGALIGERWQVGDECVLQVTSPRIPCRTFAGWLAEKGWERRFTHRGAPGAYLRVVTPGRVQAGDPITVVRSPHHDVTINFMFRALTTEKRLMPDLLAAGDALTDEIREEVTARMAAQRSRA
ncbi:MAG TPA: MOSC domain-containing protein [Candidatus Dormibacteraeota bacterium]